MFSFFGTPKKEGDPPKTEVPKIMVNDYNEDTQSEGSQTSFTPSMTKQDSFYGSAYEREEDPEKREMIANLARRKYRHKTGGLSELLKVPTAGKGIFDPGRIQEGLDTLATLPDDEIEDRVYWMKTQIDTYQKFMSDRLKQTKDQAAVDPTLGTSTPDSGIPTSKDVGNKPGTGVTIVQQPGHIPLHQMTVAQAVAQELEFARLRKVVGSSKSLVTRALTSISKNKGNRKYLDGSHKKLDELHTNLERAVEMLVNMPNLTEEEKSLATEDFYKYEIKIQNAKHDVTTQLTHLNQIADTSLEPGKKSTASKKTHFAKASTSDTDSADAKAALAAVRDYEAKQPPPPQRVDPRVQAQEAATQYRTGLLAQARAQDSRYQDERTRHSDPGPSPRRGTQRKSAALDNQQHFRTPPPRQQPPPSSLPPRINPPNTILGFPSQPPPALGYLDYQNRNQPWRDRHNDSQTTPPAPAQTRAPAPQPVVTFGDSPEIPGHSPVAGCGIGPSTPSYKPPGLSGWTGEYRSYMERPVNRIVPKIFDGTTKTTPWTIWKQNFTAIAGNKHMEDALKIVILLDMLEGEPARLLMPFSMEEYNTATYEAMWNVLEANYGGIHRQRNTLYKMIERFPAIKKFNKENTMQLENLLTKIMKEFACETGTMDQGGVLNAQVKKLIPEHELQRYFLKLGELGKLDTISNFNEFVRQQRNAYTLADIHLHDESSRSLFTRTHDDSKPSALTDPDPDQDEDCYQYSSHPAIEPKKAYVPWSKNPESTSTTTRTDRNSLAVDRRDKADVAVTTTGAKTDKSCSMCQGSHMLYQCPEFKALRVPAKYDHVKQKRCCLHCLNEGHLLRDCTFHPKRECGIDGCSRLHHRQLHNRRDGLCTFITIEAYLEQEKSDLVALMSQTQFQTNFTDSPDNYCAIRTATVLLKSGGKARRVVVAMDPCSNSTNIDADLAKEMGLKVEKTGIEREINILEGSALIKSEVVSFTLSPLHSSAEYPVKAYTVQGLISGTPVVDWTQVAEDYPHLKKAAIPKPEDGDRVLILLGTDFAHLNGTSHGIIGEDYEPIAEFTKLGWAFSGRVKTDQVLRSWVAQFGAVQSHYMLSFCSYMAREDTIAPWKKQDKQLATNQHQNNLNIPPCTSKHMLTTDELFTTEVLKPILESNNESIFQSSTKTSSSTVSAADIDLACIAAFDPNPGLFTYLSILPTIENNEKLHELDVLIKKNWEIESLGLVEKIPRFSNELKHNPSQHWTKSEQLAASKMNVKYLPELKQFQISIPWKDDPPNFSKSNRAEVKARQDGVCNRLGEKISAAQKIFDGYLEKGYIRKLEKHEIYEQRVFYLPFFTVVKEESTTPVRIVWDCAAKFFGRSLNSEIMPTPNCLQNLFTVLLRVRKFPFVVMSDISEMFLKVRLDPQDRKYHRFVFNGKDYEWLVMLFGNRSSPDGSQMVIQANCELHGKDLPEAVETVMHSCYMDDGADSRETEEIALKLALELTELFQHCGMPVHKFFSNSDLVCKTLDRRYLAKQISFSDSSSVIWDLGKVLGLIYSVSEGDVFTYSSKFRNVSELVDVKEGKWTKRHICKASAAIFDPLGLISPFVVRSRVIMQEVWRLKIQWDEVLPETIQAAWKEWLDQVFVVPDIKITRWSGVKTKATHYQIHTFCDASEEGYCVAVYIRIKQGSVITTNLLTAKSRVSPLKAESISRQELVACVLAVRLTSAVKETYPSTIDNTFYWTDSEVCLHWINLTAKSFKAFVAHRVGEIQTYTEPRQWLHVPSALNPADIGTRTITASGLKDNKLWWEGPEFLKLKVNEWPKTKVVTQLEKTELKQPVFLTLSPLNKAVFVDAFEKLHPRHFSVNNHFDGYRKCVRKWAFLMKVVDKMRKREHHAEVLARLQGKSSPYHGSQELTPLDMQAGLRFLVKQAQLEFYELEIKLMAMDMKPLSQTPVARGCSILQFNPFLDEYGVIRSKSRLAGLNQSFEMSHPIILNRHSDLTRLIAEKAHFEFQHPVSFSAMKASLRQRYAILGLGTLCTQIRFRCTQCKRQRGTASIQQLAPLPARRIGTKLKAFEHVGLDFAGPFELKVGRGKARKKVWVLVLACMVVRAVHFEVTGGLDTTCVINAISRFCDVRGVPETITSDNQTSFHSADENLKDWYASINWVRVAEETGFGFKPQSPGITWYFNPPLASHFGGIFEIVVKAAKRAMNATIGRADLNEEEFRTVVSKTAHLLNCRPIQLISDVNDYETLTPNHFLLSSQAEAVFPPDVSEEDQLKLPTRLRHQIMMQQHVWKRFQEEIVPMLGPRSKWCREFENLKENDVVLEIDNSLPRGVWRLLRVVRLLPSTDGLVRSVEVLSAVGKTFLRPISRLIPITRE